jgi:CDP-glucose 4,6-dehydratase
MKKFFKNKKVLITGNTGFKGSWLSLWMNLYGAKVLGISSNIPSKPSNFNVLNLKKKIKQKKIDLRNSKLLNREINNFKPDYIFHLAAEAIVKKAYKNPKLTWETNTLGTVNLLESICQLKKKIIVVIITSDKVYKNLEISRGYHENDILGGFDPYSASKASADLAVQSYYFSKLKYKKNIRLSIARAGNVIGGGDWSEGRLIPDCIKKWSLNKTVQIRNPNSTRPWQHVLDVLNGYISLATQLNKKSSINGEAFNFGPKNEKNREVYKIVKEMSKRWFGSSWKINKDTKLIESNLLKLNSSKAKRLLNWECKLNLKKAIHHTVEWYKTFYFNRKNIKNFSTKQIVEFEKISG